VCAGSTLRSFVTLVGVAGIGKSRLVFEADREKRRLTYTET
jgi:hypothetical protein